MTQLSSRTQRLTVFVLMLAGGITYLIGILANATASFVVGAVCLGLGFIAWALAQSTRQDWTRTSSGGYLPRWATLLVLLGGFAFLLSGVLVGIP
jgi:hypothetical protein